MAISPESKAEMTGKIVAKFPNIKFKWEDDDDFNSYEFILPDECGYTGFEVDYYVMQLLNSL